MTTSSTTPSSPARFSLLTKLRYQFDNAIARGPGWFIASLMVIGLLISVVVTFVAWIF